MSIIEWTQKLSVSVEELDRQHKKLVNLINQLHDSMRVGKGRDVLGSILNDLTDHTVYHFETEEKLLLDNMYPAYAMHKKEHNDLTRQVKEIKTKFDQGDTALTEEFMGFLKDWLNNHIMQADKKYADFLNSKGIH